MFNQFVALGIEGNRPRKDKGDRPVHSNPIFNFDFNIIGMKSECIIVTVRGDKWIG